MAIGIKKTTTDRAKTRMRGIFLAIGLILSVIVISGIASFESTRTIEVVQVKSSSDLSNGIGAGALITDDMVEKGEMNYKDFKKSGTVKLSDGTTKQSIVTWANKDQVVGKRYSAYFLRQGTSVYWDSTLKEQPKKNSYLYSMTGELLKLDVKPDDFGNMLVPGDTLNIRVSYSATSDTLPTSGDFSTSGSGDNLTVDTRLFNEVKVLDMLNSQGESIFDIYYDFMSLSKSNQQAKLKDSTFISSLKPSKLLIEATSEEVDNYMRIQEKSPKYTVTMLPRTSSNAIIDTITEIEKQVSQNTSGQ